MTLHRPVRAVSLALVLTLALLTSACGGGGDGDPEGDNGGEESILRVATDSTVVAIDPHEFAAESSVITVSHHVFDSLVEREGDEFVPRLAEEWENPDENTWIFHLRDDVTFHDGTPVTAHDFKASLERLLELDSPHAPLWATLDEVEATDDHMVTIRTTEPMGTMLTSLSLLFVLPADKVDDPGFFEAPVGSGAYRVEEFIPDERTVLVRNDDYWGEPAGVDRIELHEIPELSTRMTALETGEIDLTIGIPQDQVARIEDNPELAYDAVPSYTYSFIWFNHEREPFDDVRVRRAMWHALDIESVVADIMGESATVAQAPIPQSVFGASQQQPYEHDPELARDLLAEAGYPDGFEAEIQYFGDGFASIRDMAAAFISQWAEVGITVTPREKQRAEWIADLEAKDYDLNLQGNTVQTGDADYTLGRLYTCEADRMNYCNEELDELLLAARTSLDLEERQQLYTEAARIIWEDAVGIFPTDFVRNAAWYSYVEGFEPPPARSDFHDVTVNR